MISYADCRAWVRERKEKMLKQYKRHNFTSNF